MLAYQPEPHDGTRGEATPFDTGGIFIKKVFAKTLDGLTGPDEDKARREYVLAAKRSLVDWRKACSAYLQEHFSAPLAYVQGEKPVRDDPTGRLHHPKNERRAWTWEVRLHDDHPLFQHLIQAWVLADFHETLRQRVLAIRDDTVRRLWLDRLKTRVHKVEMGTDLYTKSEKEMASWL